MILHLGNNCFVKKKDILMILDYAEAVKNRDTASFLKKLGQGGVRVSEDEIKSIAVTGEGHYYSPISSKTLLKRSLLEVLWEKSAGDGEYFCLDKMPARGKG